MVSPGGREKTGGVRCQFPIGLGQAFRGGPHCTHKYIYIPTTARAH